MYSDFFKNKSLLHLKYILFMKAKKIQKIGTA